MGLVGDRDRERGAAALRRHYLEGRLSEDELDARLDATLRARTRLDLLLASRSLPRGPAVRELAESATHAVARAATLVVLAAFWLAASVVLLAALLLAALFDGVSETTTLAFLLAWLGMTWLVWRHWRGAPH